MFKDFYLNVELTSENAKMPTRAHDEDAGMDVYTPIDFIIPANGDFCVPLDIKVEFPIGYAMLVEEKSGVATKKKLSIGAKVIDSNYRGICHVHLFNHSNVDVSFSKGDKIAQVVIYPIWSGTPTPVNKVNSETTRGTGGFGSSGDR